MTWDLIMGKKSFLKKELSITNVNKLIKDGYLDQEQTIPKSIVGFNELAKKNPVWYDLIKQGGMRYKKYNMRGIFLSGKEANFSRGCFSEADLSFANLSNGIFTSADFRGIIATQIDLRRADLTNADFTGADIEEANLRGAIIHGTKFEKAILNFSSFHEAIKGRGANFNKSSLKGVSFQAADLRFSTFFDMIWDEETYFDEANLWQVEGLPDEIWKAFEKKSRRKN